MNIKKLDNINQCLNNIEMLIREHNQRLPGKAASQSQHSSPRFRQIVEQIDELEQSILGDQQKYQLEFKQSKKRPTFVDAIDNKGLQEIFCIVHETLQQMHPYISRMTLALYDETDHSLVTYMCAPMLDSPVKYFKTPLKSAVSLQKVIDSRKPRVTNDMSNLLTEKPHTKALNKYAASYTVPLYQNNQLLGLLIFNSDEKDVFDATLIELLDAVIETIQMSLLAEISTNIHLSTLLQSAFKHSAGN